MYGRVSKWDSLEVDCSSVRLSTYCRPDAKRCERGSDNDGDGGETSYEIAVVDWLAHLKKDKPHQFIVEQAPEFRTATSASGKSILQEFLANCRSAGYTVCFFIAPHSLWVEYSPKVSMVLVGMSEAAGGRMACEWFIAKVKAEMMQRKEAGPCCTIWADSGGDGKRTLPGVLEAQCPTSDYNDSGVATTFDLVLVAV